ncbi:MAG: hypothetical protein ABWY10_08230 [Tardiphaga sp.]
MSRVPSVGCHQMMVQYNSKSGRTSPVSHRVVMTGVPQRAGNELTTLQGAPLWTDTLLDKQREATAAHNRGDEVKAWAILSAPNNERQMDRSRDMIERLHISLVSGQKRRVASAAPAAKVWKISEQRFRQAEFRGQAAYTAVDAWLKPQIAGEDSRLRTQADVLKAVQRLKVG